MGDVKVLTAEDVAAGCPTCVGKPVSPHFICTIKDAGYTAIRELGPLGTKESPLRKLDLSANKLTRLTGIHQVPGVTWLNAANNKLTSQALVDISHMKELVLLNVSHNNITGIPPSGLKEQRSSLKVLLLNNNRVSDSSCFGHLHALNALVLSNNKLSELHPSITKLVALTKLSLGHNSITTLPDLSPMIQLAELRLNDNNIATLPVSLASCSSIRLVDIGNNKLKSPDDLLALKGLRRLVNLNLKGNPVCDSFASHDEYVEFLKALCPRMTILDGKRLDTSKHDKSTLTGKHVAVVAVDKGDKADEPEKPGLVNATRSAPVKRSTVTRDGHSTVGSMLRSKAVDMKRAAQTSAPSLLDAPQPAITVKPGTIPDPKPAPTMPEAKSGSKRRTGLLGGTVDPVMLPTKSKRSRKNDSLSEPAEPASKGVQPRMTLHPERLPQGTAAIADSLWEYDVPTPHGTITVVRSTPASASTKEDVKSLLASAPFAVSAWD